MLGRYFLVFFLIFNRFVFSQAGDFTKPYEDKIIERLMVRAEAFFYYSAFNPPSVSQLKELREKTKDSFDEKIVESYDLQIKGDKKGAFEKWQEIYLFSENLPRLHNLSAYNLGFLQFDRGNDEDAMKLLEEVIDYDGEFIKDAYYLRALIEYNRSQYQEALEDIKILFENDYAVDDNFLYKLYKKLGWNSDKITSFLEAAVERNPKNVVLLENLSRHYEAKGEHKKAIEGYEKVIKIKPSAEAYFQLAIFYDGVGNTDKALRNVNSALKLNAKHPDYYLFRGILYGEKKSWEKAIADILKGMDLLSDVKNKDDSLYEKSSKTLTRAYVETKQYEKALSCITTLYDSYPSEEALSLRASVYALNGKIKEGINDYSSLIRKNKKNPLYYQKRAKLYHEIKEDKKALSDLKTALKFDEKNIEVMNDIVLICFLLSKPKDAVAYLEMMIKSDSKEARHYFLLGLLNKVYKRDKKHGEAELAKAKSMSFDARSWLESEEAAALSKDIKIKKIIDEIKLEY